MAERSFTILRRYYQIAVTSGATKTNQYRKGKLKKRPRQEKALFKIKMTTFLPNIKEMLSFISSFIALWID